jgi:hypothetical protein
MTYSSILGKPYILGAKISPKLIMMVGAHFWAYEMVVLSIFLAQILRKTFNFEN